VLLASLRERIVGELIAQPLTGGDAPIEVASAHLSSSRAATRSIVSPRAPARWWTPNPNGWESKS
jgi:hypothetical protein